MTGLYDDHADAVRIAREIAQAGVPASDISLVARGGADAAAPEPEASPAAQAGVAVGTLVGGGAGLAAGLGAIAIPGIGPVVATGWLVATVFGAAVGATAGAAAGGLVGALTDSGVSPEDASAYAEGVRRGGTLLTARVEESLAATVAAILQRSHPVGPEAGADLYRGSGWTEMTGPDGPIPAAELPREHKAPYRGPSI
jgi:hypothetical protein